VVIPDFSFAPSLLISAFCFGICAFSFQLSGFPLSACTWQIDNSRLQRRCLAVLSLENAPRDVLCLAS
jgi:hypothetical protein